METITNMTDTIVSKVNVLMDDMPGLFSLVSTVAIMIMFAG